MLKHLWRSHECKLVWRPVFFLNLKKVNFFAQLNTLTGWLLASLWISSWQKYFLIYSDPRGLSTQRIFTGRVIVNIAFDIQVQASYLGCLMYKSCNNSTLIHVPLCAIPKSFYSVRQVAVLLNLNSKHNPEFWCCTVNSLHATNPIIGNIFNTDLCR